MSKKKINNTHLKKIRQLLSAKGYLNRDEVKNLMKEFNFCKTIMYRELIENKLPFQSGSALCTMRSLGIDTDGKTVSIAEIKKIPEKMLFLLKNMKTAVIFDCKVCGEESKSRIAHMLSRSYFKGEPYCSKCIGKSVTSDEIWREKNSKSQFVAQNKPEQKEKNRNAQLLRFKDESLREQYRQNWKKLWGDESFRNKLKKNASEKSIKNWSNPEYAKKVIENSKSKYKTGFYKEIFYQSGYELAFLLKFESENMSLAGVKRFRQGIQYKKKNGKTAHYYPDYVINHKLLIEVKGYGPWIDLDVIERKNKAAKKWCKENNMKFRVVEKQDLSHYWINKAKIKHNELNENKIKKGI